MSIPALYDAFAPVLYGFVLRMLPEGKEAANIIKQLFVYLADHIDEYNSQRGPVLNWLLNTARIMALEKMFEYLQLPQHATHYSCLTQTEKIVYSLFHHKQSSIGHISEKLLVPVPAVEFLLRRATVKLQQQAGEHLTENRH
jgi:DNA-directed RNA polymerase specialized sigma24 family protein